jgi:hypothetical protein
VVQHCCFWVLFPSLVCACSVPLATCGEAKLGMVYLTDAKTEPQVELAGIYPDDSHPPIVYSVAVIATSANPDEGFLGSTLRREPEPSSPRKDVLLGNNPPES